MVAEESKKGYIETTSIVDIGELPSLKRRFSLWSTSAFQYSLICSVIAIATYLSTVIGVGGPPFLIYGYILSVICDLVICFSLAEIASAYPHPSAQVHWTYCLAPRRSKRLLSFIVGILSCAGWLFGQFAVAYTSSLFILGLAQVFNPDYVPKDWHYYLIYLGIAVGGYLINVFAVFILPAVNYMLTGVINIGTLFIIITLLVKTKPKQSARYVFESISNETGWSSKGVVFFLSLLPSIASVTFYDGAAHMTDEIPMPERNIPLVMVISNTLSAIIAFLAVIVYMFCVVSPKNMSNPVGGEPIIQIMADSFESKALTAIGVLVIIVSFVGSYLGYACSGSRLTWSFASSGGLPFGNSFFGKVHPKWNTPVNALSLLLTITLILGTVIFGSSTALSAILGSSMVCINLSYIFPIACLLFKSRFTLSPSKRFASNDIDEMPIVLQERTKLPYFNLGFLGQILNIISVCWGCFIMVWLNFPTYYPVTSSNMNYACVVLGITFIVAALTWTFYSRKFYVHQCKND